MSGADVRAKGAGGAAGAAGGQGATRRCAAALAPSRPRASVLTRARASRLQSDLKKLMVRSHARRLARGAQRCTRPPGRVLNARDWARHLAARAAGARCKP
jgi:hypothetical protein